MALVTFDNVIATVGDGFHTVSLTIEDDGLVVGPFGKLSWAGARMGAEVSPDGCLIRVFTDLGRQTCYFVPLSSFGVAGGARVMPTFAQLLMRSAAAAGAQVVQPAA